MGKGGSDKRRYNVGVISEWHQRGTDYNVLLSLLKPGDLVEMKREGYCHWAVFIGDYALSEDDENDDLFTVLPCIVHRANPTDNPENLQGGFSVSSSRSLNKGAYGIGDVVVEPLRDVWGRSGARINNSADNSMEPFPGQEVVERVLAVVHGEDRQAYTAYNVVTNNCEHFVTWARNGWSISSQVAKKSEQLLKLGMLAGAAILPRPISILGGLCMAGLQVINEVRRSPSTETVTDIIDLTDDGGQLENIRRQQ